MIERAEIKHKNKKEFKMSENKIKDIVDSLLGDDPETPVQKQINDDVLEKDITLYKESLSEEELRHVEILENLSFPCRSNSKELKDEGRLKMIRNILESSDYNEIYGPTDNKPAIFSLWSKKPFSEIDADRIYLVTAHIDTVKSIEKCYSILNKDGLLHGTYDNQICDAAITILMNDVRDFPDNVLFAFTGDEETGRCNGAVSIASAIVKTGKIPVCIALDVTSDGFYENSLCSLENLSFPKMNSNFIENVANVFLKLEPEGKKCFNFIKKDNQNIPQILPNDYLTNDFGECDEAFAYKRIGLPTMSLCIPTSGSMHSESGLYVKHPVFEGYLETLKSFIYYYSKSDPEKALSLVEKRASLQEKAEQIRINKPKPIYFNDSIYDYDISTYHEESEESHEYDDEEFEAAKDMVRNTIKASGMKKDLKNMVEDYDDAVTYIDDMLNLYSTDLCEILGGESGNQEIIYDALYEVLDEIYYSEAEKSKINQTEEELEWD